MTGTGWYGPVRLTGTGWAYQSSHDGYRTGGITPIGGNPRAYRSSWYGG